MAFLVTISPALAAECGAVDKVTAFLERKYKEQPTAMGLVGDKGYMQLFVAPSGTWTVLLTAINGISCIIAAGDSYDTVPIVSNDTPS